VLIIDFGTITQTLAAHTQTLAVVTPRLRCSSHR
jgi:hypothetical protein